MTRKPATARSRRIAAGVLGFIAVASAIAAAVSWKATRDLTKHGVVVTATVVDSRPGGGRFTSAAITAKYTTTDGRTVTATSHHVVHPLPQSGASLRIRYDSTEPESWRPAAHGEDHATVIGLALLSVATAFGTWWVATGHAG